jgi:hypothetical protein
MERAVMHLLPARDDDLNELAAFVNAAYHGDNSRLGWTTEADLFDGQRTDAAALRACLAAKAGAVMLMLRDDERAPLLGCVWLEPHDVGHGIWECLLCVRISRIAASGNPYSYKPRPLQEAVELASCACG